MAIFDYNYLYSAYDDDTTFLLKDIISIKQMVDTFFSEFSGPKPNLTKCELADIGVLKGVQLTVCGMPFLDLNINTLKILGTFSFFSCNKKLKEDKVFYKSVTDIQWVLKIWKMRKLTLEGKIVI